MDEEIHSLEKNQTWELVNLPQEKELMGVKYDYKTKLNENGNVQKYKARLVAKVYLQQPRIDYNEIYMH